MEEENKVVKTETATPSVKYYKLRRRFWNGNVEFPVGHIEPFVEGTQPKSAIEVKEPELVEETDEDAETKAKPKNVKGK